MSVRVRFCWIVLAVLACASVFPAAAEKKPTAPVRHPPTYYLPHLLPSIGDAAEKIQFLAPHISYGSYTGANRINIDHNGVQMFFSVSGVVQKSQYFWSWGGGYNAPVAVPYQYNATFSLLYSQLSSLRYADGLVYVCKTNNDCDTLTTPDIPQDHMLMDALLTLAVAAGNTDVSVIDMAWESLSAKELKKFKLNDARRVQFVDANTPGDAAGLHPGDILTAIEKTPYHQNIYGEMAARCLKVHPEGCTVHVDALRDGAPVAFEVQVKPAFSPEQARQLQAAAATLATQTGDSHPAPNSPPSGVKLGIRARNLAPADLKTAQLSEASGVLVEGIDPGGLAETMKLQPGDIIQAVNEERIASLDDLKKLLTTGHVATITVWRAGAALKLEVPESL